jgi:deferrochelatase/peroxidase EfeB
MRRVNTRDSLDPSASGSSKLNNRRRLLRRGLPYGEQVADDNSEHGVIVMALCASITRQFEFVQQQWLQYGLDSSTGNDDCPLLGARLSGDKKFVVPVAPESGEAPFICADLPKFVEARGGEYFFVPSMTALRMIGMGTVDPT